MQTHNSVVIDGDLDSVYNYASQVEKWPQILPHYRRVDILEPGARERLVSMHCIRAFGPIHWPCKWRAKQNLSPEDGRILFSHVSGPAKGMKVEWKLNRTPKGIETSIHHDLQSKTPWGRLYAGFIGPVFIQAIAGQTLNRIKALVESEVKE